MKKVFLLTCMAFAIVILAKCQHENTAPVIDSVTADPDSLVFGDTTTLSAEAHDADEDPFWFWWSCEYGEIISPDSISVMWTAPDSQGIFYINVIADDGNGGADTDSVDIRVFPN